MVAGGCAGDEGRGSQGRRLGAIRHGWRRADARMDASRCVRTADYSRLRVEMLWPVHAWHLPRALCRGGDGLRHGRRLRSGARVPDVSRRTGASRRRDPRHQGMRTRLPHRPPMQGSRGYLVDELPLRRGERHSVRNGLQPLRRYVGRGRSVRVAVRLRVSALVRWDMPTAVPTLLPDLRPWRGLRAGAWKPRVWSVRNAEGARRPVHGKIRVRPRRIEGLLALVLPSEPGRSENLRRPDDRVPLVRPRYGQRRMTTAVFTTRASARNLRALPPK